MSFFKRKADPDQGIREFWAWWTSGGADQTAAAIGEGQPARMVEAISSRVDAIDPGLAWELAAGTTSEHQLVVTSEGNPALRPHARRWLLAAPNPDVTWSYTDLRAPVADPEGVVLSAGDGLDIAFSDIAVAARREGNRLDVTIHHPSFTRIPREAQLQIAFLALDSALGEADVELWVGEINTFAQRPQDAFGLAGLRTVIADLKADNVAEDGGPTWALIGGQGPRGRVMASTQIPLHPLTAPHLTTHVAVEAQYEPRPDNGFPTDAALEQVRAIEEALESLLAGDGRVVAHESSAGTRVIHAYVDPASAAVGRVTSASLPGAGGKVKVKASDDPGWEHVRHLRT